MHKRYRISQGVTVYCVRGTGWFLEQKNHPAEFIGKNAKEVAAVFPDVARALATRDLKSFRPYK